MERKPKSLAIHFGSRLARPSIQIFRIPRVWKRNNPTLPRKLVRAATSPGGDQRSFPQTPILASFLPSLSFQSVQSYVCIIPSTYRFYDLFHLVLSSATSIRSIENSSSLQTGRDEIFVIRVSLDKYFPLST